MTGSCKGPISFTEEKYKSNLVNVDKKQESISLHIVTIEEENRELSAKILETKKLYLEAYSRRENIKFENINEFEEGSDKEDTGEVLCLFMETELGFMHASTVERVHRLGKKKENEPGRYFLQVTFHRSQLQVTQYLPQNSIKIVLTVLIERGKP